jgi:hypothetical protein
MKDSLAITDLTQMGGQRVCIAGYLNDGTCVRPVLSTGGLTKEWLYEGEKAVIRPFSIIEFEFDSKKGKNQKPHTEDWIICSKHHSYRGMLSEKQQKALLSHIDDIGISKIFGTEIHSGPGWYVRYGEGDRSIGTISNPQIWEVLYAPSENKFEYRIAFTDRLGSRYNLAITDLTFRYFLDHLHFRENLTPLEMSQLLVDKLRNAQLFLRIGLARRWEKYPDRCYLQVNGIYSFPDYLNGKTFFDFELNDEENEKRKSYNKPSNLETSPLIRPDNNRVSNTERIDSNSEDYLKQLAKIRTKYPHAYEPWSNDEELLLIKLFQEGHSTIEIANQLQRQPSAINSRIRKLKGEMNLAGEKLEKELKPDCSNINSSNNDKILENAYIVKQQITDLCCVG